jgi:hypothetical protein
MVRVFFMEEIFKPIPDYTDYEVSNTGKVKSLKRGKVKFLSIDKSDKYLSVVLCKNGKIKRFKVHQLVAMAFLSHKPDGHKVVVDHIDNNQLNNNLDNLQLTNVRHNSVKDLKKGLNNFIGVSFDKRSKKWRAKISINNKRVNLGTFKEEIDAANAYRKALKELNEKSMFTDAKEDTLAEQISGMEYDEPLDSPF